jgi:hypothetical protein
LSIIVSPIFVPDGIRFWEYDPAAQKDAGRAKARSIFATARTRARRIGVHGVKRR